MLPAICSIVGGALMIFIGALLIMFIATKIRSNFVSIPVALLGLCLILAGLVIKFYYGWWGVLRAIIDYAKA